MRARFTQTLPPWTYIRIFFFVLGATEAFRLFRVMSEGLDPSYERGFHGFQVVVTFGAIFFGLWRVAFFSPISNTVYGAWLHTTPWSPGKPLPLGPWLLWIPDLLPIGVFCVLATYGGWDRVWIPIVSIALAFTLGVCFHQIQLGWTVRACVAAYLMVGLSLIPQHEILVVVLPVLMWVYSTYSVRELLHQFSEENGSGEDAEPHALMFERESNLPPLHWPYDEMLSNITRTPNRLFASLFGSTLVAFCWFCIRYTQAQNTGNAYEIASMDSILSNVFLALVIGVAAFRWFVYRSWVKQPISILGRIRLGMFIIPKFDVILLPPAVIVAVGFVGAWLAMRLQLPPTVWEPVLLMLSILIAAVAPPSFTTWRLTGAHTIANSNGKRRWVLGL